MIFKRYDPDVWLRVLIQFHIQYIKLAAVLSGIAAFFVSTRNRVLPFITILYYGVRIVDKPSSRPRCRSPPAPFGFEHFKKSNGGKPMKYRTPKGKRATYFYTSNGAKFTLQPGAEGITEADIASQHRADDEDFNNDKKHSRTDRKTVTGFVSLEQYNSEVREISNGENDPEQAAITADAMQRVREAIAQLPEKQAKAVTAVWLDDIPASQYAEMTGTSKANVSKTIKAAFANLRKVLADFENYFFD